jgi:alkylation response protein AidB-like acyl-CoA dehydrogenase
VRARGGWRRRRGLPNLHDGRRAADYYGILCTEDKGDEKPDARDTLYLAVPANAAGVAAGGDWNPLGMRGTVSRNLTFVMEGANDIARLAIRTCGGQSMMKHLPLERLYRDSRHGSLMPPWTAELVLDRMGREALYRPGEKDE